MSADLKVSTSDYLKDLKQSYEIAAAGLENLAPKMPTEVDGGIGTLIIADMLGSLSADASTLTLMLRDTRDNLSELISAFEQNEEEAAAAFATIAEQAQS